MFFLLLPPSWLLAPTQKSYKYGTGPPQQKKMTKYTGPTQDTKDDKSLQQLGKKLYFGIMFGSFIHVHVHYVHDHHGHGG